METTGNWLIDQCHEGVIKINKQKNWQQSATLQRICDLMFQCLSWYKIVWRWEKLINVLNSVASYLSTPLFSNWVQSACFVSTNSWKAALFLLKDNKV